MNKPAPAFRQLQHFIAEQTARKPHSPKPKLETANELTRRIVAHVRANGGFASRLSSTGTYRADLKKFVSSQQVSGLPDVLAVVNGQFVGLEVKAGKDRLSEAQKQTHKALTGAGAIVYVVRNFDAFKDWYSLTFLTPPRL
jgi:hypothetical protein